MSETQDKRGRPAAKDRPFLDELEAKPFWANLKEHRLTCQRCSACGKFFGFPPQFLCPHCLGSAYEWVPLSGKGKVYTFVTYHRAWHPSYQDKVPYNVSVVETAEGVRMMSNVIGCSPDAVKIGMAVEVVYEDFEDYTLPKFRPAA